MKIKHLVLQKVQRKKYENKMSLNLNIGNNQRVYERSQYLIQLEKELKEDDNNYIQK